MKHNPKVGDSVRVIDAFNSSHPPVFGVVMKVFMPKIHVLLPSRKIEWRENYEVEVVQSFAMDDIIEL